MNFSNDYFRNVVIFLNWYLTYLDDDAMEGGPDLAKSDQILERALTFRELDDYRSEDGFVEKIALNGECFFANGRIRPDLMGREKFHTQIPEIIYLEEVRLSAEQIEYLIQKLREAIRCNSEMEPWMWTVLENDLEKREVVEFTVRRAAVVRKSFYSSHIEKLINIKIYCDDNQG